MATSGVRRSNPNIPIRLNRATVLRHTYHLTGDNLGNSARGHRSEHTPSMVGHNKAVWKTAEKQLRTWNTSNSRFMEKYNVRQNFVYDNLVKLEEQRIKLSRERESRYKTFFGSAHPEDDLVLQSVDGESSANNDTSLKQLIEETDGADGEKDLDIQEVNKQVGINNDTEKDGDDDLNDSDQDFGNLDEPKTKKAPSKWKGLQRKLSFTNAFNSFRRMSTVSEMNSEMVTTLAGDTKTSDSDARPKLKTSVSFKQDITPVENTSNLMKDSTNVVAKGRPTTVDGSLAVNNGSPTLETQITWANTSQSPSRDKLNTSHSSPRVEIPTETSQLAKVIESPRNETRPSLNHKHSTVSSTRSQLKKSDSSAALNKFSNDMAAAGALGIKGKAREEFDKPVPLYQRTHSGRIQKCDFPYKRRDFPLPVDPVKVKQNKQMLILREARTTNDHIRKYQGLCSNLQQLDEYNPLDDILVKEEEEEDEEDDDWKNMGALGHWMKAFRTQTAPKGMDPNSEEALKMVRYLRSNPDGDGKLSEGDLQDIFSKEDPEEKLRKLRKLEEEERIRKQKEEEERVRKIAEEKAKRQKKKKKIHNIDEYLAIRMAKSRDELKTQLNLFASVDENMTNSNTSVVNNVDNLKITRSVTQV